MGRQKGHAIYGLSVFFQELNFDSRVFQRCLHYYEASGVRRHWRKPFSRIPGMLQFREFRSISRILEV